MIPEGVTPEDLAKWTAAAEADHLADPPAEDLFGQIFPGYKPTDYRVRWCAAEWLARELDELGCDLELNRQICFAHGQKCFHAADPWEIAQETLADFRRGVWDKPGYELSQRLLAENFATLEKRYGPPDKEAVKRLRAQFDSGELNVPDEPFPHSPF